MADVFISYASSERDSPAALEHALVGAGFSVWWDRELLPGRSYQEAIVAELNAASAVVVVWSIGSVGSDWVYSEARRASDQDKLVQVRTDQVAFDDLPAPFDAFHCPLIGDVDAVLRAVRDLTATPGDPSKPSGTARRAPTPSGTLPRGNVTLLRAEVESSAQQAHTLGDTWLAALTRQREICRRVWDEWHGQVLPADPDTSLVAFARAADAVGAAVALQRGLLDADWPEDARVETRVGVHTGSPQLHGEGYTGMDVERTLRVADAAHAGQILLTEATARLVAHDVPPGQETRLLGEYQLKDVPGRMRLFQVMAPGLPTEFPEPRTLGAAGRLPDVPGPIVGREGELTKLTAMLDHGRRLVTLTGPGGTGKTRLAIALAARCAGTFPDGTYFVPLVVASEPQHVWSGIADAMELPPAGQVSPGVFDYLAPREALLVLDNLEQVVRADEAVRDLLARAPRLRVVATSRRPLHVEGEVEHHVPPLALPGDGSLAAISESGAVQLFLEHARRVRAGFELNPGNAAAVAQLCVALDGLPLAIELVAARVKMFTAEALLHRLDRVLDIASSDRSKTERQRTIRGAVAWSYELLDADQRNILHGLAVFDGGASLAGLMAVAKTEPLGEEEILETVFGVVDASLVRVEDQDDGEPRFHLLETIKRFALDQTNQQDEFDDLASRHAQFFYDLAQECLAAQDPNDYAHHRALFLTELPNFRITLGRGAAGIRHPEFYGDERVPLSHVYALMCQVALDYRRYAEVMSWAQACQALADPDPPGLARALALNANALRQTGATTQSSAMLHAALQMVGPAVEARSLPDWADVEATRFQLLVKSAQVASESNDLETAQRICDELLAVTETMPTSKRARALAASGWLAESRGDLEAAHRLATQEGELWATSGDRRGLLNWANDMADLDTRIGDRRGALDCIGTYLEETLQYADPAMIWCLARNLATAVGPEHPRQSARLLGAAEQFREVEGMPKSSYDEQREEPFTAPIRALLSPTEWELNHQQGAAMNLADLMRQVIGPVDSNDAG